MEDIEPYKEQITPGKIVLFNTNWYKKEEQKNFSIILMLMEKLLII